MIIHPKGFMALSPAVGNGSDGALSTSGDVSLTSTTDGDAVVKQYSSLTVNSGHTLTVSNRCKGLHIYVQGDLVLNGTISMTARGASASNANQTVSKQFWNGIFSLDEYRILQSIYPNFYSTQDITISSSSASGGASISQQGSNSYIQGNRGNNGTSLFQCGGGGSGGVQSMNNYVATSGRGGNSTFFSGGSGSGGVITNTTQKTSPAGSDSGGAGSNGQSSHASVGGGGGAGNPGGSGQGTGSNSGATGTGGQLIIIVGGQISGNGVIESKGSNGGAAQCGGGGSGGGCVLILFKDNGFIGNIYTTGGSGGTGSMNGGSGGTGHQYYNTFDAFWNTYG
jgi:hypothetical protein